MKGKYRLLTARDQTYYAKKVLPWIICLTAALFYGYDFLIRIAPSVMIHDLMRVYKVGAAEIGFFSAFYYYAYTPLQIPAGMMVDRYRPRYILTFSAFLCALGAFISGLIPNLYVGYIARFFMGFGSAFAFIGTLKLAAMWLPPDKFGFIAGITTALGTLGAMTADIVLSRLVHHYGWQEALYIVGFIGLIITAMIWFIVHARKPKRKRKIMEKKTWKDTWERFLKVIDNKGFWFNGIVGAFLFAPVSVFASLWGVAFINQTHRYVVHHAATMTSLVFLGTAIGGPIAGSISDKIKRRRLPLQVGSIATLIIISIIIYDVSIPLYLLYALLFILGLFVGTQVLVFAVSREIGPPQSTGSSVAATNLLVTLGAAIFQPFIGYLLDFFWHGQVAQGTPVYTTLAYQIALTIFPIMLGLAFLLTFFIPETHCKLQSKYR